MYSSLIYIVLCISQALQSPGQTVKDCLILVPLGNFFLKILGTEFPGTFYSDRFYTFTTFKTPIIMSCNEYLQIYRENIDLSMKNM